MTKRLIAVFGLLVVAGVLVAATAQAGQKTHKVTNVVVAGWSSGGDEDTLLQQVINVFNSSHSKGSTRRCRSSTPTTHKR